MSNVRRFHGIGVGGRTGMRIEDGAFDLDDFMAAGRRAMHVETTAAKEMAESDEEMNISNNDGARASSSMIVANSPGPSPRSTIRRSQAPSSSSPFLSSPGTARNRLSSPSSSSRTDRKAGVIELIREQVLRDENIGSSSMSSPTKDRNVRKRKVLSPGLGAKGEQRDGMIGHVSSNDIDTSNYSRHSTASEVDATTIEHTVHETGMRLDSPIHHAEEEIVTRRTPKESLKNYSLASRVEVEDVLKPSKVKEKGIVKGQKASKSSVVLQQKNGAATQSTIHPSKFQNKAIRTAEKRKAFDITERPSAVKLASSNQTQKTVVEKVPLSYHRQTSLESSEGQDEALRRGSRYRYKPLEYWRGEKARFGRPSIPKERDDDQVGDETIDGDAFEDHFAGVIPPVAVLKEIIRVPREEGEGTFSGMKIRKEKIKETDRSANTMKKGKQDASPNDQQPDPLLPTRHAEEGWDKNTAMKSTVWDAGNDCETDIQIACTSSQVRTRLAVNSTFAFEKVFVVDHAMASGILSILVDGQKPLKNSKDNHYTFVVLEGAVRVQVHKSSFTIAPHGMFFVPRGNNYSIENISKRIAKVAFTQCRSINQS